MPNSATVASLQETISLYFRDSRSDKEYHAQMETDGNGYVVNFQYGRRGSTLQTGTKTTSAVSYDKAKKIYDKLVRSKIEKGYSPGPSGSAYSRTHLEPRASGISPQLLNPIEESEIQKYLEDEDFVLQQKHDGERRLLRKTGHQLVGINRKGLTISLPQSLTRDTDCEGSFLIDGESIGDFFHAFDLLEINGESILEMAYWERLNTLKNLLGLIRNPNIRFVTSYEGLDEKEEAFQGFRERGVEGVVFKSLSAPYTSGRPASGGTQLKYKFTETASVFVYAINEGKRSVGITVFQGDQTIAVGNVTIPANFDIPQVGDMVEVRYLYAFPGGGLFQPVYLGKRDDIPLSACSITQLKLKQEVQGPSQAEDDEE